VGLPEVPGAEALTVVVLGELAAGCFLELLADPRRGLVLFTSTGAVLLFVSRFMVGDHHFLDSGRVSLGSRASRQNAGMRPYKLLVQKEHDGEYPIVRAMNAKLASHPEGIIHLIGPQPPPSPYECWRWWKSLPIRIGLNRAGMFRKRMWCLFGLGIHRF